MLKTKKGQKQKLSEETKHATKMNKGWSLAAVKGYELDLGKAERGQEGLMESRASRRVGRGHSSGLGVG